MTLETVVVGLVELVVGAAVCFAGFRFVLLLLPLFGFIAGFWAGSAVVAAILGDWFLRSVLGWVVGLIGGIGLAILSYLFFYAAVAALGAGVGAAIGAGIMAALGFEPGLATAIVALVLAVLVGGATIFLNVPKVLVIVWTAIAGASFAVAGALVVVGLVPLAGLQEGPLAAIFRVSPVWWLVAAVIGGFGGAAQFRSSQELADEIRTRFH